MPFFVLEKLAQKHHHYGLPLIASVMCSRSNVLKAIKLILYSAGGGLTGCIFPLIFFFNEYSTIRTIPKWGFILSAISALAGAVIAGVFYYQLLYKYDESTTEKNT